jgi:aminoglycoside phosphotransferase (APT) family kinase protein
MRGQREHAVSSDGHDRDFTPATAAKTLQLAGRKAGLDTGGAQLLRLGSNAVYRLRRAPVVVRVARATADAEEARRAVAVARWLESVDYPAVRAVDVEQPVVVDGRTVTFWGALSDNGDRYASASQVGELLVRLHSLTPPPGLDLPPTRPFDRMGIRIDTSTGISSNDRTFLHERMEKLSEDYEGVSFALPPGVIHGDANVGNVLLNQNDEPTVIDLDGFSIGPREWDLIQTALFYDRLGWHTHEEYEAFVSIYGFDIMTWSGYPVLRDIRELLMVTWLAQKVHEDERTAQEFRKRVHALKSGASRKDWLPY